MALNKAVSVLILGFLFLQVINVVTSHKKESITDQVCALTPSLDPMLPVAQELAAALVASANDGVVLSSQFNETCTKLRDNTATKEDKIALGERIKSFSNNSLNVLGDMASLTKGGYAIIHTFMRVAKELTKHQ